MWGLGVHEAGIVKYLRIKRHLHSQTCYGLYNTGDGTAQIKQDKRLAQLTVTLLLLIIVLGGIPPES